MAKIAIVYYSSTGHAYEVAKAYEEGAKSVGAETRLRKVKELDPAEVVATQAGWQAHATATQHVPEATLEDLEWADGYVFGTPERHIEGGKAVFTVKLLERPDTKPAGKGLPYTLTSAAGAVEGFLPYP